VISDWWNEIIIRDGRGATFTRKEIVLHVADKDGGSHVDPKLDQDYVELSRKNSLGYFAGNRSERHPLTRPELPTLRQIAHEVLKTFVPGYAKDHSKNLGGIMVMGAAIVKGNSVPPQVHPATPRVKIGRNDKCPCGSGKKYKKCHGK
jgi:hypothetical protein